MNIKEKINAIIEGGYSPTAEYKRQSDAIENSLKNINKKWIDIKKKYELQLKNDPNSWAGIGNGSELGAMLGNTTDLEKLFMSFK